MNGTEKNPSKTAKELEWEVKRLQRKLDHRISIENKAVELMMQDKYQEATDLLNTI